VIPGVLVRLSSTGSETEFVGTRTNGEGLFVLSGLPGGVYDLQLESPGFLLLRFHGVVLDPGETKEFGRLQLEIPLHGVCSGNSYLNWMQPIERRGSMSGALDSRVVDGHGKVLADVGVILRKDRVSRTELTDSDGRVSFSGLESGQYDVHLQRKGYFFESVTVRVHAGFRADYSISLEKCPDSTCAPRTRPIRICE
jgi:hypothetical protein